MKKIITFFFGMLPIVLLSQIPQAFNYQATVRNSEGEILTNIIQDFEVEIIFDGVTIYSEQHLGVNTGSIGVINFKVGQGDNPSTDFSEIDWSQGQHQIKVKLNDEEMGLADLGLVPGAFYAQKAGNAYWIKQDSSIYYSRGNIGLGINTPEKPLHIHSQLGDQGILISKEGDSTSINLHLADNASGKYSVIDMGEGTKFRGNGHSSAFMGRLGIGTSSPQGKLHIDSNAELIRLEGSDHAYISFYQNPNNSDRSGFLGYGSGLNNHFYIANQEDGQLIFRTNNVSRMIIRENGNIGIGTTNPDQKLHVNGTTKTKILEITGGGDIKEDFDSEEKLEPGDVVVIDELNPGKLKRTKKEYDRNAIGVISGANGINPGLSLSQTDVLEGEYPLTMLGRIYVKVEGKVNVGNMLTTSSKPGFAMAVTDNTKAFGSVIGKALMSNEGGEGLILMIVNIQ